MCVCEEAARQLQEKPGKKQWVEDLVVDATMKMVMDDKAIEAIVSMIMDLQDRENTNLPLYEQQLQEADMGIQNLLNAIQQGILTKSTKSRLEELEAVKEDLEIRISNEKLNKPKVSAEFATFWLHRFRKLDVRQMSHRKVLIETFINAIYLFDDKMVITFNYKDGTKTITFDDLKVALSKKKKIWVRIWIAMAHHVGASYVSLAPTFLQKPECAHAAASPFKIELTALGFDFVWLALKASRCCIAAHTTSGRSPP